MLQKYNINISGNNSNLTKSNKNGFSCFMSYFDGFLTFSLNILTYFC